MKFRQVYYGQELEDTSKIKRLRRWLVISWILIIALTALIIHLK